MISGTQFLSRMTMPRLRRLFFRLTRQSISRGCVGCFRVLASQENVRGVDRGPAVEGVERPRAGEVSHDGVVAETVVEQRFGGDEVGDISAHELSIGPRNPPAAQTITPVGARSADPAVLRSPGATSAPDRTSRRGCR